MNKETETSLDRWVYLLENYRMFLLVKLWVVLGAYK